ncbi:MAG: hypothetical protein RL154_1127, partial [Pseudomonadota bacterium]
DICLPDLNGLDLLKQLGQNSHVPRFIVASGYGSMEYMQQAIEIGVDSFIIKPVILENLLAALYKTVSQISKQKELEQSRLGLIAANEQTIELLAMQDRFIKDTLHEINTPLAVIMATLELLEDKYPNDNMLGRIDAASRTLKSNFEDLIYHTINGKAQIKAEAIDLVEFLESRIEYFRPIINANALIIDTDLIDTKLPILINPVKLQRLIDNNLSNAIKYSYRNPGKITVHLNKNSKGYIFSVKNFGPKIADTKSIFERFYRECSDLKGYGIGLGIVKQICEEEAIDIKVESSTKNGTIFTYKFNIKGN